MGKQIRLALTENDLKSLEMTIKTDLDVLFIEDKVDAKQQILRYIDTLTFDVNSNDRSIFCFITRLQFSGNVKIRKHSEIKYAIDVDRSSVIELWRPLVLPGGRIRPGRLYYEPRTREGHEYVSKDVSFVRWADSVLSRVRRSLVKDPGTGLFAGLEAAAAMAAGQLVVE